MKKKMPQEVTIRREQEQDIEGIRQVNRAAFGGEYEVDVVDQLRFNCPEILSLVAIEDKKVIGHILFSPAQIAQADGLTLLGMGLGPLAVLPERQNQGIGSALCQEGMRQMEKQGAPFVVVLGHPEYYPRFGFERASIYGVKSSFEDVPDEAFMICIFNKPAMARTRGVAHYRPEFGSTA